MSHFTQITRKHEWTRKQRMATRLVGPQHGLVMSNLENWIFGNNASSKDVSDGNSVKSVHGNVATPVGETDTEPKLKNLLVKQKNLVPNSKPVSSESWTSHWVGPLHSCEIWRSHQRCLIQVLLWQMETAEAITTTAQLCLSSQFNPLVLVAGYEGRILKPGAPSQLLPDLLPACQLETLDLAHYTAKQDHSMTIRALQALQAN